MKKAFVLPICLFAVTAMNTAAFGMKVADFENYSEGYHGWSFLDPSSGMSFYDFTHNGSIEYVGPEATRTIFSDTNYLTGEGYIPGDGYSLVKNFGLTADLGFSANSVSVDVFYSNLVSTGASILTLNGYGSEGSLVQSETLLITGYQSWKETSISINTLSSEIIRIKLIADGLYTGYDNITAIPEPAAVSLLALGGLALRRRNNSQKRQRRD